jgi:pyruvate,water dikinase
MALRVSVPASVVDLEQAPARDPSVAGAKAAALARAIAADLPVLPGFVLPTHAGPLDDDARAAWGALSDGGRHALVVRSSSTVEDMTASSMAGRFVSCTDVRGWDAFVGAIATVRDSASRVDGTPAPMAVLVQPALDADRGGVLFGLDPVTGATDRLVVECGAGSPERIVSGQVTASRYVLSRRGRVLDADEGGTPLSAHERHRLAELAAKLAKVFGAPQDVEWAIDRGGQLWLLQSRPVTAVGRAQEAVGPILGPGPIGETFPDALRRLECDLFIAPLRIGVIEALRAIGIVPHRTIARSPVVRTVDGRVAADLELLGWVRVPRGWGVLNPVPPMRRLKAAWHVGRLRRALPGVAADIVTETDDRLRTVPPLENLTDEELLGVLRGVRADLIRVHGFQILCGMLLPSPEGRPGASSLAMSQLRARRARGEPDNAIVAAAPVVLALTPPRVGPIPALPVQMGSVMDRSPDIGALEPREALRLRARWLDELAARTAWALGGRLAEVGTLASREDVALLSIAELADATTSGAIPQDVGSRRSGDPSQPPLPALFRLTRAGEVVAVPSPMVRHGGKRHGARGAGGGRGVGPVRQAADAVEPGDVLVVSVLSPSLAGVLPSLAGLVSETGSTLSHLAILARECGVPTVVGAHGAQTRFAEGTVLIVDGTTGELSVVPPRGEVAA